MNTSRSSANHSVSQVVLAALAVCAITLSLSEPARAQQGEPSSDAAQGPHGWVQIFTNYAAVVTVDGEPYPRRSDNGMKVSANARHAVHVKMGDKEKSYTVVVQPRELRTLLVDLSGYQTPPTPGPKTSTDRSSTPKVSSTASDETGKLTVYSKPKGEVYVDGNALGASTPMINRELEIGRHEVQVKWESSTMSEVKTVRIRKGSKLKLFFRDRNNKLGKK